MSFQPFAVARYGVWLALVAAAISAWLGHRAGATFDFSLLRAVLVFVIVAALGFAAEAVLTIGFQPPAERPREAPETGRDE